MTRRVEPLRASALPVLQAQAVENIAGSRAFVFRAAGAEIHARRAGQIRAEAKSLVGQFDRAIRIAFTRCNRIAEARDENVAHRDLACQMLRRLGSARHIDRDIRGAAVTHAKINDLAAIERRLPRVRFAVVEAPRACRTDRHCAGKTHRDRMIGRREIAFLDVVAGTRLGDASARVDAQTANGIARPAASVALRRQRLFGCKYCLARQRVGLKLKVALFAKQTEAVAHLP